jgi:hypothetical protein
VEHDLHQDVAQLLEQMTCVAFVDRLGGFKSLLDEVPADAFVRLLVVPRAASVASQQPDDSPQVANVIFRLIKIYHTFTFSAICF